VAVQAGEPSQTAQRVAALRLTFDRAPAPFGDPASEDRLASDVAGELRSPVTSPMRAYLAARTAFFDRVVVGSLDRGVAQVGVAAAGYDGRALRYAKPGVRWFEVDHPDTQRDKRARLERLGIAVPHLAFVAADFGVDDVADALVAVGLDTTAPSLFLCEGVAVYLERTVLDRLLRSLRQVAGPGSRLAISVSVATDDDALIARRAAFGAAVAAMGEPARTVLTADDAEALFTGAGWQVVAGGSDRARLAGLVIAEPA
jgi:methyltransferase (TIGR00027 family)